MDEDQEPEVYGNDDALEIRRRAAERLNKAAVGEGVLPSLFGGLAAIGAGLIGGPQWIAPAFKAGRNLAGGR